MTIVRPYVWKKGSTFNHVLITGEGPSLVSKHNCATWLYCVMTTPLEIPVVPLEKGKETGSSFGLIFTLLGKAVPSSNRRDAIDSQPCALPITITERSSFNTPALKALSAREGMVMRYFALELVSWRARSWGEYCGLMVVLIPPSRATPWKMIGYSITFGR